MRALPILPSSTPSTPQRTPRRTHQARSPDPDNHHWGEYAEGRLLVAESASGRIQGYVGWGHPTPLPASTHVMQLKALAVHPDHHGQGIGRALVLSVVDLARHRGAEKVSLRVLGTNTVARRLYTLCGFVVEGLLRHEFLLDGRLVDDLFMAHYLDEETTAGRTVDAPRTPPE